MMVSSAAWGADLLIDDFGGEPGVSALGTRWQGFTDRVMGGRSDMQAGRVEHPDGPALQMRGEVRLDNNGGFIQLRLPLDAAGKTLDAARFSGVLLTLRGAPGAYFLHLRTPDCRRPWQYYRAALDVTQDWREVFVPFDAFEGVSIRGVPDLARLRSLALVAYGEVFTADLEVRRIAFVAAE
ncbi:MAG: CIA30 family protein [Wenzhouxiangellaceae bacterium]|nr:CIA30 family protein [Wenzhouxiangellaceae bacterium]